MPINLLNEGNLNKYLTSVVFTNNEVPHWVSDNSSESQKNLQTPDWVKAHKDEVVKAILLQYFKKRIREYLKENSDVSYLTPVNNSDSDLPEWCKKALSENKPVYKFDSTKISHDLQEKISTIRDYLYAMADRYVMDTAGLAKKTEKISKIRLDYLKSSNEYATFDMVLSAANLWHEKLAKGTKKVRKDEAFYNKSIEGTEFIMKLPNNTAAYRLLTPEALDFESDNMGHCVGSGYYDKEVIDGTIKIYSIRDYNGEPHVTFEVSKDEDEYTGTDYVQQCKGKQNKAPAEKYMDAILALVEKMQWDIRGDKENVKLIKDINKKCYNLKRLFDWTITLPPDTTFEELDFSKMELTKLPNLSNAKILGSFDCSGNNLTSLEGAPKECGIFTCSGNNLTSLEGAPKKVDGFFTCSCNNLTSLKGAPKEVGGDFDCSNNQLTSLKGAPKEVGGNFNCSNNQLTSLKGAPKEVGGNFSCFYNKLTSLDGAPKEVGGDFSCSCNNLKSIEGAPQKVGGSFFCSNNELTSLEGAPKAKEIIAKNNPLIDLTNKKER